jgi:hypothetical protein
MDTDQATQFAKVVLQEGHQDTFQIKVDGAASVAKAFRQLGCVVKRNLFRTNMLSITPPAQTQVARRAEAIQRPSDR